MTFGHWIICISYSEPILWFAVWASTELLCLAILLVGSLFRRKIILTLLLVCLFFASPLITIVTLQTIYGVIHPNAVACVFFVRPALLLPFAIATILELLVRRSIV